MEIKDLSVCFTTNDIAACKDFYTKYMGAIVTFDYSWYTSIMFMWEDRKYFLSFMAPQNNEPLHNGEGMMINMWVPDVDKEYERLQAMDIGIIVPIKDNPWGDRSFQVVDPIKNRIYIYSDRKPAPEFMDAYNKQNEIINNIK